MLNRILAMLLRGMRRATLPAPAKTLWYAQTSEYSDPRITDSCASCLIKFGCAAEAASGLRRATRGVWRA